jgi:hypothetical protein
MPEEPAQPWIGGAGSFALDLAARAPLRDASAQASLADMRRCRMGFPNWQGWSQASDLLAMTKSVSPVQSQKSPVGDFRVVTRL